MFRNCCVALPRGSICVSAVCDCGISWSYSLTIFSTFHSNVDPDGTAQKGLYDVLPSIRYFL